MILLHVDKFLFLYCLSVETQRLSRVTISSVLLFSRLNVILETSVIVMEKIRLNKDWYNKWEEKCNISTRKCVHSLNCDSLFLIPKIRTQIKFEYPPSDNFSGVIL